MEEEYVDIVDDNDKVIRTCTWHEMFEGKLLHRSSNVLIFNSKGQLFVNKRARNLKLYPGMLDIKFGGTVSAGESYKQAAKRELMEETNIKNPKLEKLFFMKTRHKENNANRTVFKILCDKKIKVNKSESSSGKFMAISSIKKLLAKNKLSLSAKEIFKEFLKHENARK